MKEPRMENDDIRDIYHLFLDDDGESKVGNSKINNIVKYYSEREHVTGYILSLHCNAYGCPGCCYCDEDCEKCKVCNVPQIYVTPSYTG